LNTVGVDVGGTKIAAGVVTPGGEVLSETRYPTPTSRGRLVESIAGAIREVMDSLEVGGVCLAVPGLILAEKNQVVFSPNLRAIEGIPLKEELEPRIGLPLTIENDANAAAWGEFRFGAGSEVDHLVFVTLGTGIGGGVITEGVLLRGAQGSGGEPAATGAASRPSPPAPPYSVVPARSPASTPARLWAASLSSGRCSARMSPG
jgi:glucokinase